MSQQLPPPGDIAPASDPARNRFFAIGLVRLGGAFIVVLGIVMMLQKVSWAQGEVGRYGGFAVSALGLFTFSVVTRLLQRRWATPRDKS